MLKTQIPKSNLKNIDQTTVLIFNHQFDCMVLGANLATAFGVVLSLH